MPFEVGKPRLANAGRKKGTPNKSTQELIAICEKHKVEPFEAMVILAMKAQAMGEDEVAFRRFMELAKYLYPQRKAIDLSSNEDAGIKIVVEDYTKK